LLKLFVLNKKKVLLIEPVHAIKTGELWVPKAKKD
jgi:hypothetical protein